LKLWLIRHAKSSWSSTAASDFERPLNARGERDGPRMASWLAQQSDPATWIWTSDARRAKSTAEFVRQAFAVSAEHLQEAHELYLAEVETMLDVIRSTPPDVESVAVVAHNPGTTRLLNLLAAAEVTDNVPTFGVARLDVSGAWHEIQAGSATLELIASPKTIA